jgi:hypothetical protein
MKNKKTKPVNYTAELWKTLKRQCQTKRDIVTDANLGKITKDGRTADGKVLLLTELLDDKNVTFKDFFNP